MAVYFVTGSLGSGKTLVCVGKIKDYLLQNRRVATNLDLNLEYLLPKNSMAWVERVPDKPRLEDLDSLGVGCKEEKESRYGLLVLDELGTWFNSRNWNDKERLPVIDWFLHARKLHWDVYFVTQDISLIDTQAREALCEHLVLCKRMDRMRIPLLGAALPKVHTAKVLYGKTNNSIKIDRWWYKGAELYQGYNTSQIFSDDRIYKGGGEYVDMRASYTMLPTAYLTGQVHIQRAAERLTKAKEQFTTKVKKRGRLQSAVYKPMRYWWVGAAFAGYFGITSGLPWLISNVTPDVEAVTGMVETDDITQIEDVDSELEILSDKSEETIVDKPIRKYVLRGYRTSRQGFVDWLWLEEYGQVKTIEHLTADGWQVVAIPRGIMLLKEGERRVIRL